jgi:hypothetical protein
MSSVYKPPSAKGNQKDGAKENNDVSLSNVIVEFCAMCKDYNNQFSSVNGNARITAAMRKLKHIGFTKQQKVCIQNVFSFDTTP